MNIIVTALFTLTLASWASASESSSLLKPLAVCDFDDEETCGWVHEEVSWAYRWAIVRDRLCLKAKVPLNSPSKKISSWLRGLAIDQSSDEIDIKVRFSSPPIPASFGVKCVVFVYSMDFGREKTSKPVRASGSLSLLQQQKGNCQKILDAITGQEFEVCRPVLLWNSSMSRAPSSSSWNTALIDLGTDSSTDFKIILEGVIPAGYPDARICVDNITSYTVPCSELEPKPLKPSTAKYTWAQYFGITFIVALAFGLLIPVLFLVGIIVVCRRRHAYRHHHCMTNGSGGGMSVSGAGSGSYGNSKLFSANLWHYIGGKEVDDDPFAEHTASIHRPPFSAHKFSDGTLGMRGDGTLDLPDVVIPSGRVVGGTLIRQTSQPAYNGAPYGYQTMVTTGKAMRYNGVPMGPPSNMLASQPNFTMDFNSQSAMPNMVQQGSQQMMIPIAGAPAPSQVMVQTDAAQQMMVQPANYFQSLAQPATPLSGSGAQPVMIAPAPAATGAITMTTSAVPVAAPAGANVAMDDNGPFVLPDPPSDHQQERDQVAAALDALNAATEPPQPRQTTSAAAVASGEHPPPGYDEAVGMAITRPAGGADAAAAPVLPPRRTAPANNAAVAAESLSLAQRYGLPVAEI